MAKRKENCRIEIREMKITRLFFVSLWLLSGGLSALPAQDADSVFFTTGFKIGEVTDSTVILWTRLCKSRIPVPIQHERKKAPMRNPLEFDNDMPVTQMEGAVEGSFGQVQITIESEDQKNIETWTYVSPFNDCTCRKRICGLKPNTVYSVLIEGRKNERSPVSSIRGKFQTSPPADAMIPVLFTSTSCQYFWDYDDSIRGFKVYDEMLKLNPLFHCQTGDFVYYDKPGPLAYNVELARHKWHAMNSWPSLVDFYSNTPLYIQKDDHDMLRDDAYPSIRPLRELTFQDGLKIWYEQVPLDGKPYRTFRWGKDLQIWLVEGREFRSENRVPDSEEKSIWGKEQKKWFTETVEGSDATFKILLSPTPVVGPDRSAGKFDNHANEAFKTEGDWLRSFLAKEGLFVINGDRHWQYVSVDPVTGLMEFSQGPSSDSHAQGWNPADIRPEHKFLRVKGGFLAVKVYRQEKIPVLEFIHYDLDGNIVNKEVINK
jgi:alkaline phosphatase D